MTAAKHNEGGSLRRVEPADLPALVALCNAHERAVDPASPVISLANVQEYVDGAVEPADAFVLTAPDGALIGFFSLMWDSPSREVWVEVFAQPGHRVIPTLLAAAADQVQHLRGADWKVVAGGNSRDEDFQEALAAAGYEWVRTFWRMLIDLPEQVPYPALPTDFTIRPAATEAEWRDWHRAHTAAFHDHFGFVERDFDSWRELRMRLEFDPAGCFILRHRDEVAGFVQSNDERAHVGAGFTAVLGVVPAYQHRGLGELLLRWVFAYHRSQGRAQSELYVDSENKKGAVRLYEKCGMRPATAYTRWELRPRG